MVLIPPVWTDKNNEYTRTLYAIRKKESSPHVQAHLSLRASATKELSLPLRQPN